MRIATWNVNSLRQRMPRVLEFLQQHDPDVLCLQETKTAPEAFPHLEFQAAGYTAADHSRGRWAGVAIVSRSTTPPEQVTLGLPGEPMPDEARWIEATVDGIRVASTYVINGRTLEDPMFALKLEFLERMRERVTQLAGSPLVLAGDLNIAPRDEDVWSPSLFTGSTHVSPEERSRLAAILAEGGLADAYLAAAETDDHGFTWWDYRAGAFHKNLGMRIDLILVSEGFSDRIAWCGIDRDYRKGAKPSDHAPLLVELRRGDDEDGP